MRRFNSDNIKKSERPPGPYAHAPAPAPAVPKRSTFKTVAAVLGFLASFATVVGFLHLNPFGRSKTPAPLVSQTFNQPAQNVTSINQSNGITAGIVNILPVLPQRTITPAQTQDLLGALATSPKPHFDVLTVNSNPEVETFADQLEAILKQAGWTLKSRNFSLIPSKGKGLGVAVNGQSNHPAAADALIVALREMNFPVEANADPNLAAENVRLIVAGQ